MAILDGLLIRPMEIADMETAVEWAAREGWNPGLHDAACFYVVDPAGFIGAELEGQMLGCVSAVQYDENFAFGGFFLVKPEWRGKGIGRRLVEAAFSHITARCVANDGVVAQEQNYKKMGFETAHHNIRFEGMGQSCPVQHSSLLELNTIPLEQLNAFDYTHFKARRESFIECWIRQPGSKAVGFVEDGQLLGYGVIRKCRQGYKIGPLFAARPDIAEEIFDVLSDHAAGAVIVLDIPEPNLEAGKLVKRHAMRAVFETVRMYRGPNPGLPLDRIFGITSFELG